MNSKPASGSCACGSGIPVEECCARYIDGTSKAASAEALMRSRYTAYTRLDQAYIRDTWHGSTRPEQIDMDPALHWIRLKIISSSRDRVEFIATYKLLGKAYKLHETSRFVYENQAWFYLDGILTDE